MPYITIVAHFCKKVNAFPTPVFPSEQRESRNLFRQMDPSAALGMTEGDIKLDIL